MEKSGSSRRGVMPPPAVPSKKAKILKWFADGFPEPADKFSTFLVPEARTAADELKDKTVFMYVPCYGAEPKVYFFMLRCKLHAKKLERHLLRARRTSSTVAKTALFKQDKRLKLAPPQQPKSEEDSMDGNQDRRFSYRWFNTYLVASHFTFGYRRVEANRKHVIRTFGWGIGVYLLKPGAVVPNHSVANKTFNASATWEHFTLTKLRPESTYVINSGVLYLLVAWCKTIFAIDSVPASLALPGSIRVLDGTDRYLDEPVPTPSMEAWVPGNRSESDEDASGPETPVATQIENTCEPPVQNTCQPPVSEPPVENTSAADFVSAFANSANDAFESQPGGITPDFSFLDFTGLEEPEKKSKNVVPNQEARLAQAPQSSWTGFGMDASQQMPIPPWPFHPAWPFLNQMPGWWGVQMNQFPWGGQMNQFPWGGQTPSQMPWGGQMSSQMPWGGQTPSQMPWGSQTPSQMPWGGQTPSQTPSSSQMPSTSQNNQTMWGPRQMTSPSPSQMTSPSPWGFPTPSPSQMTSPSPWGFPTPWWNSMPGPASTSIPVPTSTLAPGPGSCSTSMPGPTSTLAPDPGPTSTLAPGPGSSSTATPPSSPEPASSPQSTSVNEKQDINVSSPASNHSCSDSFQSGSSGEEDIL